MRRVEVVDGATKIERVERVAGVEIVEKVEINT